MSRSLETAIVFPTVFVLLLLFAALVFIPYPGLRDESTREVTSIRASTGALLYQFSRERDGRPQLESRAERLLELLSVAEDGWYLLSSAYASGSTAAMPEHPAAILPGPSNGLLNLPDSAAPMPLRIAP